MQYTYILWERKFSKKNIFIRRERRLSSIAVSTRTATTYTVWNGHTWYLSPVPNLRFLYMTIVEKYEIYPHLPCGNILYFPTWQIWKNFKYSTFLHNEGFITKIYIYNLCKLWCFVAFYVVLFFVIYAKSILSRYTRFFGDNNWAKNCAPGEKMTNIRHGNGIR